MDGITGLPRSPAEAIRRGMALVTEGGPEEVGHPAGPDGERQHQRCEHRRGQRLVADPRRPRIRAELEAVRAAADQDAVTLTHIDNLGAGGNQQKTIVARWLAARRAAHPRRADDRCRRRCPLRALPDHPRARDEGRGVLLISSDLGGVVTQCDRILVMYKGVLQQEFRGELDRHRVMVAATGRSSVAAVVRSRSGRSSPTRRKAPSGGNC